MTANDQTQKLYRAFTWVFNLPYRIYLDDGRFDFRFENANWQLTFTAHPNQTPAFFKPFGTLQVTIAQDAQFEADASGIAGYTEVSLQRELVPHLPFHEIFPLEEQDEGPFSFPMALRVVNYFIGVYRVMTNEYWLKPVSSVDLRDRVHLLLPRDSDVHEPYCWASGEHSLYSGYLPKSDAWHGDFSERLRSNWRAPFFVEMMLDGQDALHRERYRTAIASFALAAEALFRSMVAVTFPGARIGESPVHELMNLFYSQYGRDGSRPSLPVTKRQAAKYLSTIWQHRDEILHGHEPEPPRSEVEAANDAIRELAQLWYALPAAGPAPHTEGAFSGAPPARSAQAFADRAMALMLVGKSDEARFMAVSALELDRDNSKAKKVLETLDEESGRG